MKMQLIKAEKIASVSRVYLDTSVTASNTGKRLLTVRSFFWPVGLGGAGFFGGYGRVTAESLKFPNLLFRHEFRQCRVNFGKIGVKVLQIQADANKIVKTFEPEIPKQDPKRSEKPNGSQHIFTKKHEH